MKLCQNSFKGIRLLMPINPWQQELKRSEIQTSIKVEVRNKADGGRVGFVEGGLGQPI